MKLPYHKLKLMLDTWMMAFDHIAWAERTVRCSRANHGRQMSLLLTNPHTLLCFQCDYEPVFLNHLSIRKENLKKKKLCYLASNASKSNLVKKHQKKKEYKFDQFRHRSVARRFTNSKIELHFLVLLTWLT